MKQDYIRYRNIKTGVTFDSPCVIAGGNWAKEEDYVQKVDEKKEEAAPEEDIVEDGQEDYDLNSMKIAELRDLAGELHIDLGTAEKKDEIIKVVEAFFA